MGPGTNGPACAAVQLQLRRACAFAAAARCQRRRRRRRRSDPVGAPPPLAGHDLPHIVIALRCVVAAARAAAACQRCCHCWLHRAPRLLARRLRQPAERRAARHGIGRHDCGSQAGGRQGWCRGAVGGETGAGDWSTRRPQRRQGRRWQRQRRQRRQWRVGRPPWRRRRRRRRRRQLGWRGNQHERECGALCVVSQTAATHAPPARNSRALETIGQRRRGGRCSRVRRGAALLSNLRRRRRGARAQGVHEHEAEPRQGQLSAERRLQCRVGPAARGSVLQHGHEPALREGHERLGVRAAARGGAPREGSAARHTQVVTKIDRPSAAKYDAFGPNHGGAFRPFD